MPNMLSKIGACGIGYQFHIVAILYMTSANLNMTNQTSESKPSYCLLYDSECPMCSAFANFVSSGENGQLEEVDARKASALKDKATRAGMDLDYGIVVEHQGQLHYAAAALTLLANRKHKSFRLWLLYLPFRLRLISHLLYPLMVRVRWILLRARKKSPIFNIAPKG